MTWGNIFSKNGHKKRPSRRNPPLFIKKQWGGTQNDLLREIREEVSLLTDENLEAFQEKIKLKVFNAILGRPLRDTNVDKLKNLVEELKNKEIALDKR